MQLNRVFTVLGSLANAVRAPATPRALEIDLTDFTQPTPAERAMMGIWISDDGAMRLSLLPNGRYSKVLEAKSEPYRDRYEVDGSQLYFEADSGKTGIATERRGVLTLGDHRFVRAVSLKQGAISPA